MANNAAQIDTARVALDADRLEVYRVARESTRSPCGLFRVADASLRDQVERASSSIVLNIAEG